MVLDGTHFSRLVNPGILIVVELLLGFERRCILDIDNWRLESFFGIFVCFLVHMFKMKVVLRALTD